MKTYSFTHCQCYEVLYKTHFLKNVQRLWGVWQKCLKAVKLHWTRRTAAFAADCGISAICLVPEFSSLLAVEDFDI